MRPLFLLVALLALAPEAHAEDKAALTSRRVFACDIAPRTRPGLITKAALAKLGNACVAAIDATREVPVALVSGIQGGALLGIAGYEKRGSVLVVKTQRMMPCIPREGADTAKALVFAVAVTGIKKVTIERHERKDGPCPK